MTSHWPFRLMIYLISIRSSFNYWQIIIRYQNRRFILPCTFLLIKINFSRYQTTSMRRRWLSRRKRSAGRFFDECIAIYRQETFGVTFVFIIGTKRLDVSSRRCCLMRNVFTFLQRIVRQNSLKIARSRHPLSNNCFKKFT